MVTLSNALLVGLVKSLLRGKSILQAFLAYWVSPMIDGRSPGSRPVKHVQMTIQDFLKNAETSLLGPTSGDGLMQLSRSLKQEFIERLRSDVQCMLPSYTHQLPTGQESGQYLALDVGGSTLRVALVELRGSRSAEERKMEILSMRNFKIDQQVKALAGMAFFDWMAARICETVSEHPKSDNDASHPLLMALAWSFPIEQISLGSGKLLDMGKSFLAIEGLEGRNLDELIKTACEGRGLHIEVEAIMNDSTACLLSQAFSHPSTRFGLILGTGVNLAAYLPVATMGSHKYGQRPAGWFDEASHVVVNTELSMFGRNSLPLTKWDRQLQAGHRRPDFQPFEYQVSGMYLGEIARFALIDAIEATGVFGGIVPPSLHTPYALSSETLSVIESDTSSDLSYAIKIFSTRHPSVRAPTTNDMKALRSLASLISVRSSAIIATSVYTFWEHRIETQQTYIDSLSISSPLREAAESESNLPQTMVSFNGSVIENYPGYLTNCQRYIDELVQGRNCPERGTIKLVPAKESSLLGAAVASACVVRDA